MKRAALKSILFATVYCVFTITVKPQTNVSASSAIRVSVTKGIGISQLSGDLDLGEVILNDAFTTVTKKPGNGLSFEISGSPYKSVIINYSNTELNNSFWISKYNGVDGILNFIPLVEYSTDRKFESINPVNNNNCLELNNNKGTGFVYLRVGGNLQINQNQPAGDYEGQFTITVSY